MTISKSENLVLYSMILLGLGYLAPYNSVLTAVDYFTDKFGSDIEYYVAAALVRISFFYKSLSLSKICIESQYIGVEVVLSKFIENLYSHSLSVSLSLSVKSQISISTIINNDRYAQTSCFLLFPLHLDFRCRRGRVSWAGSGFCWRARWQCRSSNNRGFFLP